MKVACQILGVRVGVGQARLSGYGGFPVVPHGLQDMERHIAAAWVLL